MRKDQLLLAYYGDDFTGSTDVLEVLSGAGIKTVLFIEPPTVETLQCYEGLQAFGVGGLTRSMPPQTMETFLYPHFESLRGSGARHIHYKVCSTFDSSPSIGSIGKAIDVGVSVFGGTFVPLLVAAPSLGRYCAFGNLFARMGIGSNGAIFRLDRHPSMSRHPVTPAGESDLRLHLAEQTAKSMGLVDILQMTSAGTAMEALRKEAEKGKEVILIDALYEDQMTIAGGLIDACADGVHPLFSVGSSGIEMALSAYWGSRGIIGAPPSWPKLQKEDAVLVVSGSCSPVTAGQIAYAAAQGFASIALDTEALAAAKEHYAIDDYVKKAVQCINKGHSVVIHTSAGADDSRIERTDKMLQQPGMDAATLKAQTSLYFGTALGKIARAVIAQTPLKRVIVAGGDTSSYAARAMGIEAVEMIAPLSPGAPLCRAYAPLSAVDGCEVNFKGGQVGAEDYFVKALGEVS
jgi:uncharacterized protein YgbK (DUF1537 family)